MFLRLFYFFFFNDPATTVIYTLSLHDALPIYADRFSADAFQHAQVEPIFSDALRREIWARPRSEEHTSELQSRLHLVCRLLLEKKKNKASPKDLLRVHFWIHRRTSSIIR